MPRTDDPDRFDVLHALRIKGFAPQDVVAEFVGGDQESVAAALLLLEQDGAVRHRQPQDMWQITSDGRQLHASLLTLWRADAAKALPVIEETYLGPFLPLNVAFKELCTDWQLRDDEPNDHCDPGYDAAIIDQLAAIQGDLAPVLEAFAHAAPCFQPYRGRFESALARTLAGETSAFAGVMCGSYHDAWMELHQDLILKLRIDRKKEGSF